MSDFSMEDGAVWLDGWKVARVSEDGALRMTAGNKELRPEVEAWLEARRDDDLADGPVQEGNAPPVADAAMGDKDPRVIAWWFQTNPAEAHRRYANRRGTNLDAYLKKD